VRCTVPIFRDGWIDNGSGGTGKVSQQETGGVVCTWPLGWFADINNHRTSFLDWANETLEVARHIGIEHVGLGTDGGGGLPELIEGYGSILDLPKLVEAMEEVWA
jgi:microsomal dipeptidase-like Zn-dependent dipeptidase